MTTSAPPAIHAPGMPPKMLAAVQQEAERMFGAQAARLQAPLRFPVVAQQAPSGLVTQMAAAAPGQPIRIRGPAAAPSAIVRAGPVPPPLSGPADMRKIVSEFVRAQGEISGGDLQSHAVGDLFVSR
jgi:hypothetical protein